MQEKLGLKDFLSTKTGTKLFRGIEKGQSRLTDLYHILYISPSTLNKYLNQMLDLGLTEIVEYKGKARGERKKRVYRLTEKGKELIEPIEKIRLATQKIEEIIEELSKGENSPSFLFDKLVI